MREVVDIHTHILPGIDDGAKNWDMCLKMINRSWVFWRTKNYCNASLSSMEKCDASG